MLNSSGRRYPSTNGKNSRVTPHKHFVDLQNDLPPADWGVGISSVAIDQMSNDLAGHRFGEPSFDYQGVPDWTGRRWCDFALLGSSVVWCLWPPDGEEPWRAQLDGVWLDDAPGIWACFTRAFSREIEIEAIDADFFAGRGSLQMVPERIERLRDAAGSLQSRWDGSALNLLDEAGYHAATASELVIETIPGFSDRPLSAVGGLRFDKLAHLAIAMMAARSPHPITGLGEFPVYPDYMLPRHLRHQGVLVYSPDLAMAVDRRRLIPEDSDWEHAIRWATIYAAEQLRARLTGVGNPVTTPQLDYYLWWEAVLGPRANTMGEHHRTVTKRY